MTMLCNTVEECEKPYVTVYMGPLSIPRQETEEKNM